MPNHGWLACRTKVGEPVELRLVSWYAELAEALPNHAAFFYFISMKQKIPGILFLLAMPLSVLLYIKVEAVSGSEILGLFAAVALYVVVALVIALFFNKNDRA